MDDETLFMEVLTAAEFLGLAFQRLETWTEGETTTGVFTFANQKIYLPKMRANDNVRKLVVRCLVELLPDRVMGETTAD